MMLLRTAVLSLAVGLYSDTSQDALTVPSQDRLSCGQASCFLLLSQLGRDQQIETLDSEFSANAATLSDLRRVLLKHGVTVDAWKVSWNQFQKVQGPVICHVELSDGNMGHFNVARWVDGELVVLEPMSPHPMHLTREEAEQRFRKVFTGNILVPQGAVSWRWQIISSLWLPISAIVLSGVAMAIYTTWQMRFRRAPGYPTSTPACGISNHEEGDR